ncbi:MAG: thioredoxin [Pirellulales bacterium]
MAEGVIEFTDGNFESEVLASNEPVLVDFWAPWCAPCRALTPLINELAAEYKGSVKIGKLDIDQNTVYAQNYGVSSIPTLLIFKGGQIVDRFQGGPSKAKLQAALDASKA